MNEKIRLLFEQAHIQPPVERSGQFAFTPPKTFSPEKFAELIVAECADLFTRTHTDEQYQRRIDKTIRKHFGVEE